MLLYRHIRPEWAQGGAIIHPVGWFGNNFRAVNRYILPIPSWDLQDQLTNDPADQDNHYQEYFFPDTPPSGGKVATMPYVKYQKWYNFTRYIRALFRDWNFIRDLYSVPGENPVIHRNLFGIIESGDTPLSYYHTFLNEQGVYTPSVQREMYNRVTFTSFDARPITYSISGDETDILGTLTDYGIEYVNETVNTGVFDQVADTSFNYLYEHAVVRTESSTVLTLTSVSGYDGSNGWDYSPFYMDLVVSNVQPLPGPFYEDVGYDISALISFDIKVVTHSPLGDSAYESFSNDLPTRDEVRAVFSLGQRTAPLGTYPSPYGATYVGDTSWYSNHFIRPPLQEVNIHEYIGFDSQRTVYYNTPTSYKLFMDRMTGRLPDFIVGTFESSQDALDKNLGGLDSNYIETLIELRSILDPLQVLEGVRVFLSRKYRGGLLEFLKLLANADLAYNFGIAPSISDAMNLHENLIPLIKRIQAGDFLRPLTVHGKSTYTDLTDDAYFSPYAVECRSKVRLNFNVDSFLPYILPLQALGLLPSLSNIWDLIPYSWLIDDFVNISKSLELLDASVIQAAYDIEFSVHSITVTHDIANEEKGFYSPSVDDLPVYKLYNRFVLNKGLPVLGPTTLPLLRTTLSAKDIYASFIVTRIT